MKKFLLKSISLSLVALILTTQTVFAIPNAPAVADEDIDLDVDQFEEVFQELSALEEAVLANEITSGEEAIDMGFEIELFAGLDAVEADLEFDWPAALWGFLCCPIGFFVYVTNKNRTKDEKTSYWIGVAAGTVVNIIYVAAVGTPDF